jgi:hypothetical protein
MRQYLRFILVLAILFITDPGFAYPLDAYPETGIRRVEAARLAVFGKMRGRRQPPGALLPAMLVDLRLLDHPDLILPEPDPQFSAGVLKLLGNKADRYGVAVLDLSDIDVLDLSDIDNPRYAEHRADYKQNVGSVGKIAVAMALFQALADCFVKPLSPQMNSSSGIITRCDSGIPIPAP